MACLSHAICALTVKRWSVCYYFTVFKKHFNMKIQLESVEGLVSLRRLQLRYQ